jgi:patatin-like phospholipase/acyl hydrolase
MPKTVKVLSIDGGGIRGIIPAMILAQIEQITQKPISSLFDLVAGTSTGGILALGLVKPGNDNQPAYSAQNMLDMYENEGPKIFSRDILHRIASLGNITDEKYPSKGIEGVLEKYFGESRLKDVLTSTLITSYEIERRISWFFKSSKAKLDPNSDFLLKEVARSTSAAPTYFEANRVDVPTEAQYYAFIDGGVYANNPAMCAYVEAKNKFPEADKIVVVSLGTGARSQRIPFDKAKDWGLAQWVQPLLGVVFDGVDNTVDYQLNTLLSAAGDYYRFQIRLDEGEDEMDNASAENMRELKLLGERLIREQDTNLHNLCNRLLSE